VVSVTFQGADQSRPITVVIDYAMRIINKKKSRPKYLYGLFCFVGHI